MSDLPGALSEEHQAVREAVRAVCDAKVALAAAQVDEAGGFPQAAYDALAVSDFAAPHVGEEYDGAGADALATCIVIEEIARACASSSLIPSVIKLGSMPVILAGSEELKKKYLSKLAPNEGMFSYCLSEPDAGSDAAAMKTKAVSDGDDWVLNGVKRWITNASICEYYTVFAVTDPDATQIYEGTHLVQPIVVARQSFAGCGRSSPSLAYLSALEVSSSNAAASASRSRTDRASFATSLKRKSRVASATASAPSRDQVSAHAVYARAAAAAAAQA